MRVHRHILARISSVLLLAGAFVVMNAARADATLILYLCNDASCVGGDDFIITDNMGGDGNFFTTGSITFFTADGGTVTASSYPNQGTPAQPVLTLGYNLTASDLISFGTPFLYAAQDLFTGQGTAIFEADASNGGGIASLYAGAGAFAPPGGVASFSCMMDCLEGPAGAVPVPPYYLALGITPTASASGGASGDATVTVPQQSVPDGGSAAALLGSVLLGFGILRRKFKY